MILSHFIHPRNTVEAFPNLSSPTLDVFAPYLFSPNWEPTTDWNAVF
jgi:hypothetical protein